jgi:hypothetical protein
MIRRMINGIHYSLQICIEIAFTFLIQDTLHKSAKE